MIRSRLTLLALGALLGVAMPLAAQQARQQASAQRRPTDARLERLKTEALANVDARAKLIQEMVDEVFSFGELGMQEFETSKYLTGILEKNGFTVERGVAGIPTAWVAKWGSGKPVIALGSDLDDIPQASSKPGVGDDLGVSWGASGQSALISAEFHFAGVSAHAAGAPWRGRSALDAAMLMGQGWEFRREHIRPQARSHYVIKEGGDQPNVVPSSASIWFYFREQDYTRTMELFETAKRIAEGAAMMTDTKLDTVRILGSAWDGYFSKPIAEATYENIKRVGLPTWSDDDQALARAVQAEVGAPQSGLRTEIGRLRGSEKLENWMGGGSDDIGDVSWNVPTVTLRYPSNIPGLPGHMWANAIAMATPIAHKGAVAGAKVQALTLLDLLTQPQIIADAWTFFHDVQTKDRTYKSFLSPTDQPPTWLNADIMAKYRPEMRKYYYDPSKYPTYLDQLGIKYPTLKPKTASN